MSLAGCSLTRSLTAAPSKVAVYIFKTSSSIFARWLQRSNVSILFLKMLHCKKQKPTFPLLKGCLSDKSANAQRNPLTSVTSSDCFQCFKGFCNGRFKIQSALTCTEMGLSCANTALWVTFMWLKVLLGIIRISIKICLKL